MDNLIILFNPDMKATGQKYFFVFLLFVSMLSPSCNGDGKKDNRIKAPVKTALKV